MSKIVSYFEYFIKEINLHFDYLIREGGSLLYVIILLVAVLVLWFVWQNIKIKKVLSDLYQDRAFED